MTKEQFDKIDNALGMAIIECSVEIFDYLIQARETLYAAGYDAANNESSNY